MDVISKLEMEGYYRKVITLLLLPDRKFCPEGVVVGNHPGVLEFRMGFFVPEKGDEVVVASGEEIH